MTPKIDSETELPTIPGDPVSQEIRDEENLDNLKIAWYEAMWAGWSIDEEKPDELPPVRD